MRNKCPICGEPAVITCRCMRGDSSCKNKHHWHTCTVHGYIVLGKSDHSKTTDQCTCRRGGTYKYVLEKVDIDDMNS